MVAHALRAHHQALQRVRHDEHLIIRVELAAVFACIDADDLEALAADAKLLSDRAHRTEEILAQRLADHTYPCAALAVRLCQVAPCRDRHARNLTVVFVDEIHLKIAAVRAVRVHFLAAVLHAAVLPVPVLRLRRPCGDLIERIKVFLELLPVLVPRTPGVDVDAVRAHRLVLELLQLGRALDGRDDGDDGRDADDDAEHGQQRADLVVEYGFESHANGLSPVHILTPSLARSLTMRPS